METYTLTYDVRKQKDEYELTCSIDKILPPFLWVPFAPIGRRLKKIALDRAKETGNSFKLEVMLKLSNYG